MTRDEEVATLRKRLAELESTGSTPPPPPEQRNSDGRAFLVLGVAVAVILIVVVSLIGAKPGTPSTPADNLVDPGVVTPLAASSAPTSPWIYTEITDPMADAKGAMACTTSTNEAILHAPYEDVSAQLCIRRSPKYGLDVFVALLGDGQILCRSYENCTLQVRFDEAPARPASAIGAADHSTNVVFLRSAQRMLDSIQDAKVTKVQLPFYQDGDQTLEFPTADLEWPPKPSSDAGAAQQ